MIYDYVIIGGGMAGLYTVQELHKKNKNATILIVDMRDYWGGRVVTHKRPHYEIGGARLNDNHNLLLKLIDDYNCNKIPIISESMFICKMKNNDVIPYYDSHKTLKSIMINILDKSKKYSKNYIQQFSLKKWIDKLSKDTSLSIKIKDIFGYHSEIVEMNAYDALLSFHRDFISNQFYIIKEGFSELCSRIYKYHKNISNITFKTKCAIIDVVKDTQNTDIFHVHRDNGQIFTSKHIIFATKSEQLKQFSLLKPIYSHLSCIYNAPLLRIYAKYPVSKKGVAWFQGLPKVTTNSIIRQIIPINERTGLIMIAYNDGDDITPFWKDNNKKELKEDIIIKKMIADELKILFPKRSIPQPTYFKSHLWTIGAHHWKPKCNSDKLSKQIQTPCKGIYIIGEAFSQKQAWVEGALETSKQVVEML
jgi:hypothetical protein